MHSELFINTTRQISCTQYYGNGVMPCNRFQVYSWILDVDRFVLSDVHGFRWNVHESYPLSCSEFGEYLSVVREQSNFYKLFVDMMAILWTTIISMFLNIIMITTAFQITSVSIVYLTVCSGPGQRKHQSSASLAFVRGIHRGPVNSPHKRPVTRKVVPFDDVIMKLIDLSVACRYFGTTWQFNFQYLGFETLW